MGTWGAADTLMPGACRRKVRPDPVGIIFPLPLPDFRRSLARIERPDDIVTTEARQGGDHAEQSQRDLEGWTQGRARDLLGVERRLPRGPLQLRPALRGA